MKKKQQSKSLLQRNLKSTLSFTLIELLCQQYAAAAVLYYHV